MAKMVAAAVKMGKTRPEGHPIQAVTEEMRLADRRHRAATAAMREMAAVESVRALVTVSETGLEKAWGADLLLIFYKSY